MKPKFTIVILAVLTFTILSSTYIYPQSQNGLKWMKQFYTSGYGTTPGFVRNEERIIIPVVFCDSLYHLANGTRTFLAYSEYTNVVFCKINTHSGELISYKHFKSNAPLTITSLCFRDGIVLLAGSYRDSLFITLDSISSDYIGGNQGFEKAFTVDLSFDLEMSDFKSYGFNYTQSGFDKIDITNNKFLSIGTARHDTTKQMVSLVVWKSGEEQVKHITDTLQKTTLSGLAFHQGHPWVCGSFADSLILSDTVINCRAGNQPFAAIINESAFPYSNAMVWKSRQEAQTVSLASNDHSLWAAINFSDTLHISDSAFLVSKGMMDGAILEFDSTIQLISVYQLGGVYSERIDKIFYEANTLFVLVNIGSPGAELYRNDSLVLIADTSANMGLQTLITINQSQAVNKEWAAQESRLGRITTVHKLNSTESIISGTFSQQLIIDSVEFIPRGLGNIYLMNISDECINLLKKSKLTFTVCQGDSLRLENAFFEGVHLIGLHPDSGYLTLKVPGKYAVKADPNCKCPIIDTLVLKVVDANNHNKTISRQFAGFQIYSLSNNAILKVHYCGECDNAINVPLFQLVPNPFDEYIYLRAELPQTANLNLCLVNSHGQEVLTKNSHYSAGVHSINLYSKNLPSGSYWLTIKYTDASSHYTKIIPALKILK